MPDISSGGEQIMTGYPIVLNLTGRCVLVVGMGPIGQRKARGLLEAGARVRGVDPQAAVAEISGLEHRIEPYRDEHFLGVELAVAAATPEVNRRVVADARRRAIWVNSTSEPEAGDFALPATWCEGTVTVAVSTGGASPALAATLRDRAAAAIGPAAASLAALLAELRPVVLARIRDADTRRRVLADWGDPRHLAAWETQGPEAVRRTLLRVLDESGP
jgi:siroheme synthase-like protein